MIATNVNLTEALFASLMLVINPDHAVPRAAFLAISLGSRNGDDIADESNSCTAMISW